MALTCHLTFGNAVTFLAILRLCEYGDVERSFFFPFPLPFCGERLLKLPCLTRINSTNCSPPKRNKQTFSRGFFAVIKYHHGEMEGSECSSY